MKKKILCLLLVFIMSMGVMAGCGGSEDSPKAEPEVINDAPQVQEEVFSDEADNGLLGGIQTVEMDVWGEMVTVSYDADSLICESTGMELNFYDPVNDAYFVAYVGDDAQQIIDGFSGYDWVSGYSASPISELLINGMIVHSFTHSYTAHDRFREQTVYTIPLGQGIALNIEGDLGDGSIIEKAFLSIEGSMFKPLSEDSFIIFKDAAGNPAYKLQPLASPEELLVISNENARIYFEYTTQQEDGSMLTRPAEIHLNAYGSGQDFFNAVSGKYWTTYTPFEQNFYNRGGDEKLVTMTGFWDTKVNGEIQQYQDCVFYFERSNGDLITGICDDYQASFIGALFENGFIPAN